MGWMLPAAAIGGGIYVGNWLANRFPRHSLGTFSDLTDEDRAIMAADPDGTTDIASPGGRSPWRGGSPSGSPSGASTGLADEMSRARRIARMHHPMTDPVVLRELQDELQNRMRQSQAIVFHDPRRGESPWDRSPRSGYTEANRRTLAQTIGRPLEENMEPREINPLLRSLPWNWRLE